MKKTLKLKLQITPTPNHFHWTRVVKRLGIHSKIVYSKEYFMKKTQMWFPSTSWDRLKNALEVL